MDYKDLKIQFRAVKYGSDARVLEWRINPEQDLRYYKEHKWLYGLIKFGTIHKYNTKWHQPRRFFNHLSSYLYTENDDTNWFPFWIKTQQELDWYKDKFKTVREFLKYQEEISDKDKEQWRIDRMNYLERIKTIY